ncbi:CRSPL inhibitor, partial [Amia calva]|nr:CRSPL inhibitor [Amia calva]
MSSNQILFISLFPIPLTVCFVLPQVWDQRLAKSAEAWATQCIWDHGPPQLMRYMGQNLSIHSGRYRSVIELVRSWYDERQFYSFPYPHECNPSCPNKCSGSVCSHYTQRVKKRKRDFFSVARADGLVGVAHPWSQQETLQLISPGILSKSWRKLGSDQLSYTRWPW